MTARGNGAAPEAYNQVTKTLTQLLGTFSLPLSSKCLSNHKNSAAIESHFTLQPFEDKAAEWQRWRSATYMAVISTCRYCLSVGRTLSFIIRIQWMQQNCPHSTSSTFGVTTEKINRKSGKSKYTLVNQEMKMFKFFPPCIWTKKFSNCSGCKLCRHFKKNGAIDVTYLLARK